MDTSDPKFGYENNWECDEEDGLCAAHYYDEWFYSYWVQTACDGQVNFICQKEVTKLSSDTVCDSHSGICYYRRTRRVTWSESRDACMAEDLILMSQWATKNSTSYIRTIVTDLGCQAHFWLDDDSDQTGIAFF